MSSCWENKSKRGEEKKKIHTKIERGKTQKEEVFLQDMVSVLFMFQRAKIQNLQMQELYGAPGYFSEAETERKKPS